MRLNLLVGAVLVCSLVMVTPASAAAAWEVDLASPGSDSTNVEVDDGVRLGSGDNRAASAGSGVRTGFAVYPRRLSVPANTFAAVVRSSVPAGAELAIDVRGRVRDGSGSVGRRSGFEDGGPGRVGGSGQVAGPGQVSGELGSVGSGSGQVRGESGQVRGGSGLAGDQWAEWTEWVEIRPEAPAVLPVAVSDVEVRVMVAAPDGVAPPRLDGLVVSPGVAPGGRGPAGPGGAGAVSSAGLSYPVFATREGLVGGTTANGHRIVARDHFVALPSRRGLAGRHGGEYSVRVCAANGRCAWAPVWDVGPWNTRDDYWAGPGVRQEWHDLPQGRPASQAAYQDGYNNGKDQFGRKVANPAGIDLADGTFWDGLQLKNNAWVTVTYQWTSANSAGYIRTPGDTLNVRNEPNSRSAIVGLAGDRAQVRIECVVVGERVVGTQGTTDAWYRLAAGMFVSAAYVAGGAGAPGC
jgi:hypothetical protein